MSTMTETETQEMTWEESADLVQYDGAEYVHEATGRIYRPEPTDTIVLH